VHFTASRLEGIATSTYSPALAASDLHLFYPVKKFPGRLNFRIDDEVKQADLRWFSRTAVSYYAKAFQQFVKRRDKCMRCGNKETGLLLLLISGHVDDEEGRALTRGIPLTVTQRFIHAHRLVWP